MTSSTVSWIQKHALYVLLRHENATVKEMRPTDVEANVFAYHLEGLQTKGYIKKVGRGTYTLTTQGQRFVGAFSTSTNRASEYIKTVIMLYGKTDDGRHLLFRWSRQPYINRVSLPHDHMSHGKTLDQAVRDAIYDKLGVNINPTFMTSAIIRIEHDGELVSHMNALVYEVDMSRVSLPYTSRNGTAFCATIDESSDAMGGIGTLFKSLTTTRRPHEFTLWYL